MKNTNNALQLKNRELQSRMAEQTNTIDSLKSQLETLNTSLRSRDSLLAKESAARREAEIAIEKLHVKIDEATRALESNKPVESENSQLEALRVCVSSPPWSGCGLLTVYSKSRCVRSVEEGSRTRPFGLVDMSSADSARMNVSPPAVENALIVLARLRRLISSLCICNNIAPLFFFFWKCVPTAGQEGERGVSCSGDEGIKEGLWEQVLFSKI
jgi:uncharacterized coiled-coil protein SlyX